MNAEEDVRLARRAVAAGFAKWVKLEIILIRATSYCPIETLEGR